jgi:hypothetical protein
MLVALVYYIIIGRLSRFIEKINVKQMKNAKFNQKATAPAKNLIQNLKI